MECKYMKQFAIASRDYHNSCSTGRKSKGGIFSKEMARKARTSQHEASELFRLPSKPSTTKKFKGVYGEDSHQRDEGREA